jgi:HEAT repeat protein
MSQQAWSQIIHDLRSTNVKRAVLACEKINTTADASRIAELYELLNDDSYFVREAAAIPLARLKGIEALPSLFQAMTRGEEDEHDNDGLVATIAHLLESNQEKVTPLLLKMVEDRDKHVRLNAAWALGFVASQISPVPLFKLIDNDESFRVRSAATASLGSFKDFPEVFDRLVLLLQDPSLHVQVAAIAALGYLGDKRAISPLQEMLRGASETIRFSIQFALERLSQVRVMRATNSRQP